MRKNYFTKNLVAASMLLAVSMGMTSCSGFVDAVLGTTDTPTTQPTTQPTTPTTPTIQNVTLTTAGAQVTANSAAEVNTALAALADDIKEKGVGEGKEYTLEVTSDVFNAGDVQDINVPEIEGATINVVIKNPFTKPTTLVFGKTTSAATRGAAMTRGEGAGDPPSSLDKMYITLPETDGENYPTIEFQRPNTLIYLESANGNSAINLEDINETSASGGLLVIGKRIAIDTYKWTPRSESEFLRLNSVETQLWDAAMNMVYSWFYLSDDAREDGRVMVKNLEILPTNVVANLNFGANSYGKITIADGAKVQVVSRKGKAASGMPKADVIESKGTSTVLTIDASASIGYNSAKGINFSTTSTSSPTKLTLAFGDGIWENGSTNFSQVIVSAPAQSADQKTYDMTFDGCEFAAGELFGLSVIDKVNNQSVTFENYDITLNFKNCKIGDAALTASNLTISPSIDPTIFMAYEGKINVYCVIDGTKYKVTWSKINGENCTLTPVA